MIRKWYLNASQIPLLFKEGCLKGGVVINTWSLRLKITCYNQPQRHHPEGAATATFGQPGGGRWKLNFSGDRWRSIFHFIRRQRSTNLPHRSRSKTCFQRFKTPLRSVMNLMKTHLGFA